MIGVLEASGAEVVAIDSSCLGKVRQGVMAAGNLARGYPWNAVSWFEPARRRRGRIVAEATRAAGCDLVLCTGTLDAPFDHGIDYAIWLDNTFALLQRSAVALPYRQVGRRRDRTARTNRA